MMNAVASRPTRRPAEARSARVGREHLGREDLHGVAGHLDENTMMKPATINSIGAPALANTTAMMAAPINAQTDVILRPHLSSAHIMNRLAEGTAKFIAKVYCSDFVIVKPFSFIMFGSHAQADCGTEECGKADHAGDDRLGNIRRLTANGSLLVLAASVERAQRWHAQNVESLEHVERFLAAAVRREIPRRFGSVKRNTHTIRAPTPIMNHAARQTVSGEVGKIVVPSNSTSAVPIGHTQAPPMKCTIARMRPRIRLGEYSPA